MACAVPRTALSVFSAVDLKFTGLAQNVQEQSLKTGPKSGQPCGFYLHRALGRAILSTWVLLWQYGGPHSEKNEPATTFVGLWTAYARHVVVGERTWLSTHRAGLHGCTADVAVVADQHVLNMSRSFQPTLKELHLLIENGVVQESVSLDQCA